MPDKIVWIWLGIMAVAAVVEMATMSLVSVWCAVGALCAAIVANTGAEFTTQMLVFLGVAIATFAAIRPLAKKYIDPHIVPTNADRLLGETGKVTEAIDNATAAGAVYVDGKTWTARSDSDDAIPLGETVEIVRMEGVKLIVRPLSVAVTEK